MVLILKKFKQMKWYSLILFFFGFLMIGCDGSLFNLPRDNPYDNVNDQTLQDGISIDILSLEIVEDNNDDGIANRLETVYLKITAHNKGTNNASGVKAKVSSDSPHIVNLTPETEIDYGDLRAKTDKKHGVSGVSPNRRKEFTIKFDILNTAPLNDPVHINIEFKDEAGRIWEHVIPITIQSSGANIAFSKVVIREDNNDDGIININELVYALVYLRNNGTSAVNGAKATITTTSQYVSDIYPATPVLINSGNVNNISINPGVERYGVAGRSPARNRDYTLRFQVSPDVTDGQVIVFDITIEDDSGNIWIDQMPVTIQKTAAQMTFGKYEIIDEENNDKKINPGETVYLRVFANNIGSSRANVVKATINSTDSNISNLSPVGTTEYNSGSTGVKAITPGGSRYGYAGKSPGNKDYTVKFKVSSNVPKGSSIRFNMNILDQEGNTWNDNFDILVE